MFHVAGGEHTGIIINKQPEKAPGSLIVVLLFENLLFFIEKVCPENCIFKKHFFRYVGADHSAGFLRLAQQSLREFYHSGKVEK